MMYTNTYAGIIFLAVNLTDVLPHHTDAYRRFPKSLKDVLIPPVSGVKTHTSSISSFFFLFESNT